MNGTTRWARAVAKTVIAGIREVCALASLIFRAVTAAWKHAGGEIARTWAATSRFAPTISPVEHVSQDAWTTGIAGRATNAGMSGILQEAWGLLACLICDREK